MKQWQTLFYFLVNLVLFFGFKTLAEEIKNTASEGETIFTYSAQIQEKGSSEYFVGKKLELESIQDYVKVITQERI